MDKDKIESKLKALSSKNKKLLQSISAHLINNPDQLQGKLHQHRFLEQKYNELIGFSRKNVQSYQKIQATLIFKQEQVKRLNKMLLQAKNQHKMDSLDYKKKRIKEEEQIQSYKMEMNSLKKQLSQTKQRHNFERKRLQQQLQNQRKNGKQKATIIQKNNEGLKRLTALCQEQGAEIKRLRQQNLKIKKTNRIDLLNDLSIDIAKLRKKQV